MNAELFQKHYICRFANCNTAETCKIYQGRYCNTQIPPEQTFRRLHLSLCGTGSINKYT